MECFVSTFQIDQSLMIKSNIAKQTFYFEYRKYIWSKPLNQNTWQWIYTVIQCYK